MTRSTDFMFGDALDARPTAPFLVLGLGNCLIEDEGIGIAAIEYLHKHYCLPDHVELLDGGTSGMGLLDDLRNRNTVIVLDAVNTGRQPGDLVVLENEQVPAFFRSKISPHQLALSDVLAVLTLSNEQPENISVIGVEPASLRTRIGLSTTVQKQLQPMAQRVIQRLTAEGCYITEKPTQELPQEYGVLQII